MGSFDVLDAEARRHSFRADGAGRPLDKDCESVVVLESSRMALRHFKFDLHSMMPTCQSLGGIQSLTGTVK